MNTILRQAIALICVTLIVPFTVVMADSLGSKSGFSSVSGAAGKAEFSMPVLNLAVDAPASAVCGDNIIIEIRATSGYVGIGMLQYSVDYDETKFQYVTHGALTIDGDSPVINAVPGSLTYSWADGMGACGATLPDGSSLITLTLKVISSSGTSAINITASPTTIQSVDCVMMPVMVMTNSDSVMLSGPVQNTITLATYCNLQAAIVAASPGQTIKLLQDISEGLVYINKELTLDGNGKTLTSTSSISYGIEVGSPNVIIHDLTVFDATTFGIQVDCGSDNLVMTNVTVNSCQGTGISMNGSDNIMLINITSTNNIGNGISITNCDNTTINGITTSGNSFLSGFSAGIGLFTSSIYCLPAGINGFTLTGAISIAEAAKVYSQKASSAHVITGLSGASITWAVGTSATDRSYWPSKAVAYAVVDGLFEPPYSLPNTTVFVAEVATENFYVEDDPNGDSTPPMSIQTAINFQVAGQTIFVESGVFNERLTVDKSITIDGDGFLSTVLSGTGLVGTGSGISLNAGITGITIRDFSIISFAGSDPLINAGIRGASSNSNLTIQNMGISNNIGGSGIYLSAVGGISNVLIENVEVSGHPVVGNPARGIVIWDGHKSNITIRNCTVYNNSCCGIELQDGTSTGVTLENNNVYNNGDNGIAATGLTGPGANIIKGNTVSNNGRFGIEIKLPNGSGATSGAGSIVIENNTVYRSTVISDARDIAGIAVFRRAFVVAYNNVNIPTGVVVRNNTVYGYQQPSASDGFGIVIEGTNHTVTNNIVYNNSVGIQQQAGHLPYTENTNVDGDQTNLPDQFFGRGNTPFTCSNTIASNTFTGGPANGVDSRNVGPGVNTLAGLVKNTSSGETFCSIQVANNDSNTDNGNTITVAAGTYVENISITKSLNILGPNPIIDPCTSTPTAIIKPAIGGASTGPALTAVVKVTSPNVTIAGLTIDGDNTLIISPYTVGATNPDVDMGISAETNASGLNVHHNLIRNAFQFGVAGGNTGQSPAAQGTIEYNKIDNIPYWAGVILYDDYYASVKNNCISNAWMGVQVDNFYQAATGPAEISNNTISTGTIAIAGDATYTDVHGVRINNVYQNTSPWTVANNLITNTSVGSTGSTGVELWSVQSAVAVSVSGNTVDGFDSGYYLWNCPTSSTVNISGSASNCTTGVLATNKTSSYSSDNSSYILSNLTLTACGTGVKVFDDPAALVTQQKNVEVNITSGVNITGGTTGLLIENTRASLPNAGSVALSGQSGDYIRLVNNANNVLATSAVFAGQTGATASPAQNFAIEDKINHKIDSKVLGFVTVKASNEFVTDINAGQSPINNDYTRIRNAVENASENWKINLHGSFDWTETNAAASWVLGNDGVVSANDDYSILVPANLNGITFTAPEGLGTAIIQGPGDLAAANLEGVLVFDGGDNQNWTISNMEFREFDLSIGMFNGSGGADAFNNTMITNNHIRIPADLNTIAAPADVNQNIGIHYSFGANQTISNNTFTIAGDGVSSGTNYSTSIVMQSNTSGGILYDGLKIKDNIVSVTGVPASQPAVIRGIWENGANSNAAIEISGNIFSNANQANTADLNRQFAFWITSTSGATKKVEYKNNEVSGFSEGISFIGGAYTSYTPSLYQTGQFPVEIKNNKFDAMKNAVVVRKAPASTNAGSPALINNNSFTNFVSGGLAVNNEGTGDAISTCNWWGTADGDLIPSLINGVATYSPWISTAGDGAGTGFQPTGTCDGTPVEIATAIPDHIICGETIGSILVSWTGGDEDYMIDWGVGSVSGISGNSYNITGLAAGNYTITVTDTYGSSDIFGPVAVQYLPVTNTTDNPDTYYATIQEAIDAADPNDEIEVCAGTYAESLVIGVDGLSLRGPNAGIDPNGVGPRAPEAIINPTEWYGIYIEADEVKIDGLTLDGLNTTAYGIYAYTGIGQGDLLVANNIIKKLTTYGFIGWVQTGASSSNNLVTKNKFDQIPGRAIVSLWNYYADMTSNVITNSGIGLYSENANQAESTGTVEWKSNNISATRSGIWYNNAYGTATPLTITDNTINVENNPAGTRWDGMWLTSLGGSINPVIRDNIIIGGTVTQQTNGYNLWNNFTTATDGITLEGGSVSNVGYGVWINNWDGFPTLGGSNANSTRALIDDVSISNASTAGIFIKDNSLNTSGINGRVFAEIKNSTISVSSNATGILVSGADAGGNIHHNNVISGAVGINVNGTNTAVPNALTIQANTVTNASQLASGIPTVGIALNNMSGNTAANIGTNNITGPYYGYTIYNLNTDPVTTITKDTIKGIMQGVAAFNSVGGDFASSVFNLSGQSMSLFTGNHGLANINFHAGVYIFTGGVAGLNSITANISDVSVNGTGRIAQDCAGLSFVDFSTGSGTMQNIKVRRNTLTENLNRGINIRGNNALIDISTSTLDRNGRHGFNLVNIGFGLIARQGAVVTIDSSFIINPEAVTDLAINVSAIGADPGSAGSVSVTATHNSIIQNTNATSKLVNNAAGGTVNATCNWWGSAVATNVTPHMAGVVTYQPFLTTGTDVTPLVAGFQPVPNSCNACVSAITNTNTGITYCSIQQANDDPNTLNGHTITVGAGVYAENVIVTKELTINGPNSNVDPCLGTRVPEAIITTAVSDIAGLSAYSIFDIQASNVSINGFTIDGDNTSITTGKISTTAADIDIAVGITRYVTGTNAVITNNIIKNVSYFGVELYDFPTLANSPGAVPSAGNVVSNNKIQDLGSYDNSPGGLSFWGGGILLYNNQYAAVTNNCMDNVRIGIQTGNFYQANPGLPASQMISGNKIQSRRVGIFHNLHYGTASAFTLSLDTLTTLDNINETGWRGILLGSLSTPSFINNNKIDGSTSTRTVVEGINIWNCQVAPHISGGNISGVQLGINVNNFEGYNSDANNTSALIDGVAISGATIAGIKVHDNPSNTNNATVAATITGATTITNCNTGVWVEGSDATLLSSGTYSAATLTGNVLHGIRSSQGTVNVDFFDINTNGVGIEAQNGAMISINQSSILINTGNGVTNSNVGGTPLVDATLNWWGNANGPSTVGFGSGDEVSTFVTYCPWLNAPVGTGINTYTVHNDVISVNVAVGVAPLVALSSTGISNLTSTVCSGTSFAIANLPATTAFSYLKVVISDPDNLIGGTSTTYVVATSYSLSSLNLVNTGMTNKSFTITITPYTETDLPDPPGLDADECYGTAVIINLTVNPEPVMADPTDLTKCSDETFNVDFTDQLVGTIFAWSRTLPVGLSGPTSGSGDISGLSFQNLTNIPITTTLTVTPTSASPASCVGASQSFDVTVNPEPVMVDPTDLTKCSDETFNVDFTDQLVGTIFAWSRTLPVGLTGPTSGSGDISGLSFQNLTNMPITTTITVTPTSAGPASCVGTSQSFDVTVNPEPDPVPITTIQACSATTYSFDLDNYIQNNGPGIGQVTYTYNVSVIPNLPFLNPDPTQIGGSSANGMISNNINNFANQSLTVRYTVTPTSAFGCVGNVFIVDVVINPKPQVNVNVNGDNTLCQGELRTVFGFVFPANTYTYEWKFISLGYGNATITNSTSLSPLITAQTDNTNSLTLQFKATNTLTGCADSIAYVFTVSSVPSFGGGQPLDLSSCETLPGSENAVFNLTSSFTMVDPPAAMVTYHTSASDAAMGVGAIMNPTMFTGTNGQEIWLRLTNGGCFITTQIVLTVHLRPNAFISGDLAICIGENTTLTATGAGVGGNYLWSNSAITPATMVNPVVSTSYTVTATDVNGCSNTSSVTVVVNNCPVQNPDLLINFDPTNTIFNTGNSRDIVITLNEVNGVNTTGTIQLFLAPVSGYTFNFYSAQISANIEIPPFFTGVNNPEWTAVPFAGGLLLTSNAIINANGLKKIAVSITAIGSSNSNPINAIIFPGSGGESNSGNNGIFTTISTN